MDLELVKDIYTQPSPFLGSSPSNFVALNGQAFFVAFTGAHGYELWKCDGTEAGTVRVKDITPGISASLSRNLTNVGGRLFFTAVDDDDRFGELRISDGTEDGTVRVKDIWLGRPAPSPALLTNVSGTLYFNADDGSNGQELWQSDGTEAGTVLVEDLTGNAWSSFIREIVPAGNRLFVVASNHPFGHEIWSGVLGSLQGDFDRNGRLDTADIDAMAAAIAGHENPLAFDLTNDALVDQLDLNLWLQLGGAANLPSGSPYRPGDANLDGTVDDSDFTIWLAHKFTAVAAWFRGDFSADGLVDGSDFIVWKTHKYTSSGGGAVTQPVSSLDHSNRSNAHRPAVPKRGLMGGDEAVRESREATGTPANAPAVSVACPPTPPRNSMRPEVSAWSKRPSAREHFFAQVSRAFGPDDGKFAFGASIR